MSDTNLTRCHGAPRVPHADQCPSTAGGYAQAVLSTGPERIVHISGQIPVELDGSVPSDFDNQARLAWRNVLAQLAAANMSVEHLVQHTTFLSDRVHSDANSRIRREMIGDHPAALTVVIAGIYDPA